MSKNKIFPEYDKYSDSRNNIIQYCTTVRFRRNGKWYDWIFNNKYDTTHRGNFIEAEALINLLFMSECVNILSYAKADDRMLSENQQDIDPLMASRFQ